MLHNSRLYKGMLCISPVSSDNSTSQSKEFKCVSNQGVYADNCVDAVDRLLIS